MQSAQAQPLRLEDLAGRRNPGWATAGLAQVRMEELRRALGHDAVIAWCELTRMRDDWGADVLHGPLASTARRIGLTPRQLRRSYEKLRAVGLVHNLGWHHREVRVRGQASKSWEKVFGRVVFGCRYRGGLWAAVPPRVKQAIHAAPGWGGPRAGGGGKRPEAGIPAGTTPEQWREDCRRRWREWRCGKPQIPCPWPSWADLLKGDPSRMGGTVSKTGAPPGGDGQQDGRAIEALVVTTTPLLLAFASSSKNQKGAEAAPRPDEILSKKQEPHPPTTGPEVTPLARKPKLPPPPTSGPIFTRRAAPPAAQPAPAAGAPTPQPPPARRAASGRGIGLGLGVAHLRRGPPPVPGMILVEGVPRRPSPALMGCAVVPPPPLLAADAPEPALVAELLRAYRGAAGDRWGRRCYVLWKWDPASPKARESSNFRLLADAAACMRAQGIAPAAWAAWSCDVWRTFGKGLPPLRWVFSQTRLVERAGWFRHEEPIAGGRVIFGKAVRDLLARWENMAAEVRWARDPAQARAVAARWFPEDLWERMLGAARASAQADREALALAVRDGRFVWGFGGAAR